MISHIGLIVSIDSGPVLVVVGVTAAISKHEGGGSGGAICAMEGIRLNDAGKQSGSKPTIVPVKASSGEPILSDDTACNEVRVSTFLRIGHVRAAARKFDQLSLFQVNTHGRTAR